MFGKIQDKLIELYEAQIQTQAKFESLEKITCKTLDDAVAMNLRLEEKVNAVEIRHVRELSELNARIVGLEDRLNMLSEKALHQAMRTEVKKINKK